MGQPVKGKDCRMEVGWGLNLSYATPWLQGLSVFIHKWRYSMTLMHLRLQQIQRTRGMQQGAT